MLGRPWGASGRDDGAFGASVRAEGAFGAVGADDCGRIGASPRGEFGAPADGLCAGGMFGVDGADGACGAAAEGEVARLGGVASGRAAFGAPAEGPPVDGLCGAPAEGACGAPPEGIPPDGAEGAEGIEGAEGDDGIDGVDGALGIDVGRGGASAREADVDMSGERGAGAPEPRSPRLPGVPVQPWPGPVGGRPAAGDDGALPPAGAPPPIGPD